MSASIAVTFTNRSPAAAPLRKMGSFSVRSDRPLYFSHNSCLLPRRLPVLQLREELEPLKVRPGKRQVSHAMVVHTNTLLSNVVKAW